MKTLLAVLAGVGAALVVGPAGAGSTFENPLTFYTADTGELAVKGNLSHVRKTSDTVQFLGCTYKVWQDSGDGVATCYGKLPDGSMRECFTNHSDIISVANSLSEASYLMFRIASDGATCSTIATVHSSYYL